jgi:hypothetical protein
MIYFIYVFWHDQISLEELGSNAVRFDCQKKTFLYIWGFEYFVKIR